MKKPKCMKIEHEFLSWYYLVNWSTTKKLYNHSLFLRCPTKACMHKQYPSTYNCHAASVKVDLIWFSNFSASTFIIKDYIKWQKFGQWNNAFGFQSRHQWFLQIYVWTPQLRATDIIIDSAVYIHVGVKREKNYKLLLICFNVLIY